MDNVLVVVRPFGRYAVGDEIKNTAEVAYVVAGAHANHVVCVRVNAFTAAAPAAAELNAQPLPHRREI